MSMAGPTFSPLLRWLVAAGCVAVPVAVLVALKPWRSTPVAGPVPAAAEPDPRLAYTGPYLNIHPDVAYVGDAECARCHKDRAESYRRHPMGRSILTVAEADQREMEQPAHHNPFMALGATLRIDRDGNRLWHREIHPDEAGKPVYVNSFEVNWIVGSGNHGHSYLTDRDGYVFQTPISWYSSKKIWDLAPGWNVIGAGRPILAGCLFCHANRFEPVAGSLNRYREPLFRGHAIGCERCHGPGARHVSAPAQNGQDFTIVNPARLEPKLREAVCQQCHLEGEQRQVRRGRGIFDFRPGLPLEDFWSVFVHAEGENVNAVNHVEQMYLSGCFRGGAGTAGQIGCISCHDPHVKVSPQERLSHYRDSCIKCHAQKGCTVPEPERRKTSAQDSCIDCHMPPAPTADIAHTASTNHRIPRKPPAAPVSGRAAGTAGLPIRSFFPPRSGSAAVADDRELGIGLAELALQGKIPGRNALEALARLDSFLKSDPEDVDALEARAHALQSLSRTREALAALRQVLSLTPDREACVSRAASLAMTAGETDDALRLWRHAIDLNPWMPDYHANVATLSFDRGDWPAARDHAAAWVRLDPASIAGRTLWVDALLHCGEKDRARSEFATIERLRPPDLESLRNRFWQALQ
jgi:hypothetical protein